MPSVMREHHGGCAALPLDLEAGKGSQVGSQAQSGSVHLAKIPGSPRQGIPAHTAIV